MTPIPRKKSERRRTFTTTSIFHGTNAKVRLIKRKSRYRLISDDIISRALDLYLHLLKKNPNFH